jgi:hypothetical protein
MEPWRAVDAQYGAVEGLYSVDQRSQIRITLIMSRIWTGIRIKEKIRIRIRIKVLLRPVLTILWAG